MSEEEFFNEVSLNDELILQREPDGFSEDSIRVYSKNGVPLGFVKNLGKRCNNLHPQSRRIRMDIV